MKGLLVATWKMAFEGSRQGAEILSRQGEIGEAILTAVTAVEDNPAYSSVGYGGLPNAQGVVELDAAYMDGNTLGVGSIMSVRDIRNPILVAEKLSHLDCNCQLVGEGAIRYAKENGFAQREMLTPEAARRWEERRGQGGSLEAYDGHDTVCVLGRDHTGRYAVGVSTSGLFMKAPGRVGDSPCIGAGYYADSQLGSAACTGLGEDIMRGCLAHTIVQMMGTMDAQQACTRALANHLARMAQAGRTPGGMSVIAMDAAGWVGAATNITHFPFVVVDEDYRCHLLVAHGADSGLPPVEEPDSRWWTQYEGD